MLRFCLFVCLSCAEKGLLVCAYFCVLEIETHCHSCGVPSRARFALLFKIASMLVCQFGGWFSELQIPKDWVSVRFAISIHYIQQPGYVCQMALDSPSFPPSLPLCHPPSPPSTNYMCMFIWWSFCFAFPPWLERYLLTQSQTHGSAK